MVFTPMSNSHHSPDHKRLKLLSIKQLPAGLAGKLRKKTISYMRFDERLGYALRIVMFNQAKQVFFTA